MLAGQSLRQSALTTTVAPANSVLSGWKVLRFGQKKTVVGMISAANRAFVRGGDWHEDQQSANAAPAR